MVVCVGELSYLVWQPIGLCEPTSELLLVSNLVPKHTDAFTMHYQLFPIISTHPTSASTLGTHYNHNPVKNTDAPAMHYQLFPIVAPPSPTSALTLGTHHNRNPVDMCSHTSNFCLHTCLGIPKPQQQKAVLTHFKLLFAYVSKHPKATAAKSCLHTLQTSVCTRIRTMLITGHPKATAAKGCNALYTGAVFSQTHKHKQQKQKHIQHMQREIPARHRSQHITDHSTSRALSSP